MDLIEKSLEYAISGFEYEDLDIYRWTQGRAHMTPARMGTEECMRCKESGLTYYHHEGEDRFYRGCKSCGLWQELNGVPYQCVVRGHRCPDGSMHAQFFMPWEEKSMCPKCGGELRDLKTYWQQTEKS